MASYLPFVSSSPFTRAKRKMSGPASSIAASLDKSLAINFGESLPISMRSVGGAAASPERAAFWAFCKTLDAREVLGFLLFEVLTVVIAVLGVLSWILFFKFVVEPTETRARVTWGGVWLLFTASLLAFRHGVRARVDRPLRMLAEHAEIFVAVSLVMMFAVNIAFSMHVPSRTPLPDLGFLLIPEQAVDSPWRPLSDVLTAAVPVMFMLQSYCMARENRVVVMCAFFRCATVCYLLRGVTIALTSLPGPAPHCRVGSATYSPPQNWIDIVTRVGPMYGNYNSCGDLIFSGHMAYTTSAVLLYLRVLDRHFPRGARVRWALGVTYLLVLAGLCVAGRKHYTVDVVLGVIVATLVFFHFEHSWTPLCVSHPLGLGVGVGVGAGGIGAGVGSGSAGASARRASAKHAAQPTLYHHKRFSVDEPAIDEYDDDDAGEASGLLGGGGGGSGSGAKAARSGTTKRIDNVALIC